MYANNAALALNGRAAANEPEPGYERLATIQAAIASSTSPQAEPIDAFTGQPASQLLTKPPSQPQSLEQSATPNANANANSGSNSNGQTAKLATSALYTNDGPAARAPVTEASRTSLASPGRSMPGGRPTGLLAPPPSNTYEQYSDMNGNGNGGRPNELPVDGGEVYQQLTTNNLNAPARQPSVPHLPPPTNKLQTQPPPPTSRSKSKRETIKMTGDSFTEKSRKFQLL